MAGRTDINTARAVRERVKRGGARFWRHRDFEDLSPSGVATALSRLAREGALKRVNKGVYYHPVSTSFGPSIAGASAAAAYTVTATLHPAGLTAANMLGLTTQNPKTLEYATPAPTRPQILARARVHTKRPPQREALSAKDGAILETLRERARSSDLSPPRTVETLVRLLAEDDTFERIATAALFEPPRVRAMLGALGQELGVPDDKLARLRESLNPLSRFDFGDLGQLRHAREWRAK